MAGYGLGPYGSNPYGGTGVLGSDVYGGGAYGDGVYGGTATGATGSGDLVIGIGFALDGTGSGGATSATGTGDLVIGIGFVLDGFGSGAVPPVVIPAQVGTAAPQVVVEVAFTTDPAATAIWTDISAYVEELSFGRGRNRELDRVQAGTLHVRLSDRTRRFDPTNAGGPYFGYVLPMRRIRVRATYNNSSYPLFAGFVDSWGQEWQGWEDAEVEISATDGFKVLNLAQLNTSFPIQTSGARIAAVLSAVGWSTGNPAWMLNVSTLGATTILGPTGDRLLSTGQTMVQASVLTDVAALSHIQDVADSEFGLLFIDRSGALTFRSRLESINADASAVLGTFGELELLYADIQLAFDDTEIWNDVRLTPEGGTEQVAIDATSQARYFKRSLTRTTLHNTDADAHALANMFLARHKEPLLQVTSMTLDGTATPNTTYAQMLGREIGDRVTVRRRPPAGGALIEQSCTIQGINTSFSAEGGQWSTTWRLSPADASDYWLLSSSTASVLGQTTRLFF